VEHQKLVGDILHLSPPVDARVKAYEIIDVELDGGHRTPQIYPSLGQHAGLHGKPGREEREDASEEIVRQGAQPVGSRTAAAPADPLGSGLHRGVQRGEPKGPVAGSNMAGLRLPALRRGTGSLVGY